MTLTYLKVNSVKKFEFLIVMSNYSGAQESVRNLDTGTTTIGIKGKGFVILGADRRATMGSLKASGEAVKVFDLSRNIGLTIAGSVGDAQKIVRIMRMQLRLHRLDVRDMSVKAAGTLLANILHANKFYPFYNQFILGGVDADNGIGHVFDLDPI